MLDMGFEPQVRVLSVAVKVCVWVCGCGYACVVVCVWVCGCVGVCVPVKGRRHLLRDAVAQDLSWAGFCNWWD